MTLIIVYNQIQIITTGQESESILWYFMNDSNSHTNLETELSYFGSNFNKILSRQNPCASAHQAVALIVLKQTHWAGWAKQQILIQP